MNHNGNQLGSKALNKDQRFFKTTIFKGYINPKKLSYCKAHQETKTEKSEDPKGNDGGYEQGGGEVDGGLCPVHREPRERVGVVGLVVLLVDPGRIMNFSIKVCILLILFKYYLYILSDI